MLFMSRHCVNDFVTNNEKKPLLHLFYGCMLFRLEVEFNRLDVGRRVMLRAVRECPSCKPLWLEGLQELNGVSATIFRCMFQC
jgi:hypothetical protein